MMAIKLLEMKNAVNGVFLNYRSMIVDAPSGTSFAYEIEILAWPGKIF